MMEVPLGDTYYFCFSTRAFATGIPTSLLGTPSLSVKEEGNDTIITTGVSVDVDTGSTPVAGLHEASVVATTGNGYGVGQYYTVYISAGTVDSVSAVGEVVGHFRVMPAEDAGAGIRDVNTTHWKDTAVGTPTIPGVPEVDVTQVRGDTGAAINLEADYDGTGYAKAASTVGTVTTVTNDVGVNEWGGTLLATTNPLPNAAAGAAGGLPTDSTGKTSFNDLSAAQVESECNDALIAIDLDHLVNSALPVDWA